MNKSHFGLVLVALCWCFPVFGQGLLQVHLQALSWYHHTLKQNLVIPQLEQSQFSQASDRSLPREINH